MLPEIEAAVSGYLEGVVPGVVRPRMPEDTSIQWARVRMLDARAVGRVEHLTDFMVQVDCYAGEHFNHDDAQVEASTLSRTIRRGLVDLEGATLPDLRPDQQVVITSTRVLGHIHLPDAADFTPPRERYVLTVQIFAHPQLA